MPFKLHLMHQLYIGSSIVLFFSSIKNNLQLSIFTSHNLLSGFFLLSFLLYSVKHILFDRKLWKTLFEINQIIFFDTNFLLRCCVVCV